MKHRALRLVRGVSDQNGYETWRVLMKDMQPSTRQRSLALVQSLNKVKFESTKSVSEQLPQFEMMIREYERTSNSTYPDDLKVAAVLSALPASLKTSLQMVITDSTTYEDIKSKIELYEQVTTQWYAESSLQMPVRAQGADEAVPMEVDAVWMKGGKKGKDGKGKSKKGTKGKDGQSKGQWHGKGGKDKGKAKGDGKKGTKGKGVTCYNCGKAGHMAKDCWTKRVQKLEDQSTIQTSPTNSQSAPSSASSTSVTSATALYASNSKQVRLITLFEETDQPTERSPISEVFDFTELDDEPGDVGRVRVVRLVDNTSEAGSEEFEDCFEVDPGLSCSIPDGVSWVSMDVQDSTENL